MGITIWKQGIQMGIYSQDAIWKWVRDWRVTIWKWGAVNPCFNTVIPIWKRGEKNQSPYVNGNYTFPFGDVSIHISWAFLLITTMQVLQPVVISDHELGTWTCVNATHTKGSGSNAGVCWRTSN